MIRSRLHVRHGNWGVRDCALVVLFGRMRTLTETSSASCKLRHCDIAGAYHAHTCSITSTGEEDSPKSRGCVTQAAILLALPPNQKGYRMELSAFFLGVVVCFCCGFSWLSTCTAFTGDDEDDASSAGLLEAAAGTMLAVDCIVAAMRS